MNLQTEIQNDLKELIKLVRHDEKYTLTAAYCSRIALPLKDNNDHKVRAQRIIELCEKFGIENI